MSTRTRRTRFYATQYGTYWSMTADAFKGVLASGAAGEGFVLRGEGIRQLKHKPRQHGDIFVYDMLDWFPESFQEALAEFDAGDAPSQWTWIWRA